MSIAWWRPKANLNADSVSGTLAGGNSACRAAASIAHAYPVPAPLLQPVAVLNNAAPGGDQLQGVAGRCRRRDRACAHREPMASPRMFDTVTTPPISRPHRPGPSHGARVLPHRPRTISKARSLSVVAMTPIHGVAQGPLRRFHAHARADPLPSTDGPGYYQPRREVAGCGAAAPQGRGTSAALPPVDRGWRR
jgi:hypothetical protein